MKLESSRNNSPNRDLELDRPCMLVILRYIFKKDVDILKL